MNYDNLKLQVPRALIVGRKRVSTILVASAIYTFTCMKSGGYFGSLGKLAYLCDLTETRVLKELHRLSLSGNVSVQLLNNDGEAIYFIKTVKL